MQSKVNAIISMVIATTFIPVASVDAASLRTRIRNITVDGEYLCFNTTDTITNNPCSASCIGRKNMPSAMTASILTSKALGTASVVILDYTSCDSSVSPAIIHLDKITLE